jgi:DNA-binding MarR family transcriptional regulator
VESSSQERERDSQQAPQQASKGQNETPSPVEVVGMLMRLMHAIRRGQRMRFGERDLSGPRSRLLAAVAEARPVRMGDLAGRLGVTARTITTLVDALEEEGLIERQADPTDRRATLIDMTPTGFRYYNHVSAGLSELAEQIVGPLSGEERRRLLDLVSRLQVPGGGIDCGPDARWGASGVGEREGWEKPAGHQAEARLP